MKVLWLANIPSPYRVKFFNELGKHCDLMVLFERQASVERHESWKQFRAENFHAIFLPGRDMGVAEAFCPSVIRYLTKEYDHIVVTTFSDPTGMLAVLYMKMKRISYEVEGDGGFAGNGKGIKEWLKKFLMSGAVRYFSTAKLHDEYYLKYGAVRKEIVRYPFTSVCSKEVLSEVIPIGAKKRYRIDLEMCEKYILLAVGQFVPRKGYDILLQSASALGNEYGVYIVGGSAPKEYVTLKKAMSLNNVHFVDFKNPSELKKYYMAADVFVHPTREDIWGLVINEAMAYGLPVVTTDKCIAGLEMIQENENGHIVGINNVNSLTYAIRDCVNKGEEMGTVSLKRAADYTIEKMVVRHLKAWEMGEI